jgi:hypothetical protein
MAIYVFLVLAPGDQAKYKADNTFPTQATLRNTSHECKALTDSNVPQPISLLMSIQS